MSVKFYSIPGERGFPQYIIRESVSELGVVHRNMIATVNDAKYVDDVVARLNRAERCIQDHD